MDPELAAKINELGTWESGGEGEKYSALTVEFQRRGGDLYVRVSGDVGRRVEHRLKELRELYSAQRERPGTSWGDERYHPLLSTIEAAISRFYREHPELTGGQVQLVLDGLIQDLEREGEDPFAPSSGIPCASSSVSQSGAGRRCWGARGRCGGRSSVTRSVGAHAGTSTPSSSSSERC